VGLREAIATPEGKRRYVRQLFATIAPRYDLITRLLSYGQDARWKRRLLRLAAIGPNDRALDLACGTGDLTVHVGLDVTMKMLQLARQRRRTLNPDHRPPTTDPRPPTTDQLVQADMTALPFAGESFTVVTTGYGLRNVPDLPAAIAEIHRVLAPGGRMLSLDFNRPDPRLLRAAYLAYLTVVGSVLGWVLHGDPDTYRYIPESIRRYPGARRVARLLEEHGFSDVRVVPLLGGLMAIHLAQRHGAHGDG
jgi:demethylmenaquinone methyltransferase/2-methoxy-6-polyprenyl-1,4-benzoquinol methylase